MVAEVLALLPGVGFNALMDMYWEELLFWRGKAVETAKRLRGMT
jgi:hypothetical protein